LRSASGRLLGVIRVTDAFVRSPREEAAALYGTEDPDHPGVRYLLSRPTGVLGGAVAVLRWRSGQGRPATPREIRATARRRGWADLVGLATTEGLACIEGTGEREGALLGAQAIPAWHEPGRDALLQAIVLKNHGAREVFLEHERSDWVAVVSRLDGEELGMTPVLVGARAPPVALALHAASAA
jgi:sulfate adenylyltransferase